MDAACCSSAPPAAAIGLRSSRGAGPLASSIRWPSAGGCGGQVAAAIAHPLLGWPATRLERPSRRRHWPSSRGIRASAGGVFERFTERAVKAVVFSRREARALGSDAVLPVHLLLGLVGEDPSSSGFLDSSISILRAREAVRELNSSSSSLLKPSDSPAAAAASDLPFSAGSKRVFEAAVEFSRNMNCKFIAPEHIALGLLTVDDGSATRVLVSLGADLNLLASVALSRLEGELAKDGRELATSSSFKTPSKTRGGSATATNFSDKKKGKGALDQFCVDLTAQAEEGRIDPVIGRDTEIQRIVQILCRRTKNNPILLGEPGVGKTAIAEGLALRIATGDIPIFLMEKRVMSLDLGLLMAGTRDRGELESRVTNLIKEVKKAGNVILFIDEVHNLIRSGKSGRRSNRSGLDIANLLKPSLGRGELQCIASTTLKEHMMFFEKDKALARRFQPVLINEPNQEDAVRILLGLREKYEAYHNCKYTLEALHAAVSLSARYIPDRHLPDKAIDLIDEAGSRARMDAAGRKRKQLSSIFSKSPGESWHEIKAVKAVHEEVTDNTMHHAPGESNKDDIINIEVVGEDDGTASPISSQGFRDEVVVGPEEIAKVASLWSGIPVQQLTADERKQLLGLEEELHKRVIGQDDAVKAISRAVKRSRVGLQSANRPIATLLFCGPTGVGKTELAKALAASYFGSEEAMVRLDMSEYMNQYAVSTLIGAPPGYEGYEQGGALTEAVRRKPFTLVLLDEIEKAHPNIFNILLQIFEDGHLTDSQGRRVSFKNTLIVMTSNVGSTSIAKGRSTIGFQLSRHQESASYVAMRSLVMEELKSYFRPELLNRIDEVVVFRTLDKSQITAILNIILGQVKERLHRLGYSLEVSSAMTDMLCKRGYDESFGARSLKRAVTQLVEDVISEAILSGKCKPGDTIRVDVSASGDPILSRLSLPDENVHLSDSAPALQ